MKTITILRAADAETGSAAGGDTEVVKRKVAEHALVNAAGVAVENEEEATGISYTLLAVKDQPFVWQSGLQAGTPQAMLAVFGAKTLATNETSQARNNPKGEATPAEQIAAVRERFDLIGTGKWVDRTREGVGAKVDKDKLATAIANVLIAGGKKTQAEVDAGYWVTLRAKLEDDTTFQRTARNVPGVNEEYAKLVGRPTKSVDDLLI